MHIAQIQLTVADYCQALEREEIAVNRDYQRSDRVWPLAARQFLIETVLLGYPIPKITLHQVTDLRTRSTRRWVVDGQQRTRAIHDFYRGDLRLSGRPSLVSVANQRLGDLSEELQTQFLGYVIDADLLVAALPNEVRDIFRRINAYTLPLNPEESRHAEFQGPCKWFIYRLSADLGDIFTEIGAFSEKQLVRMQDNKLLAEVCHAVLFGVQTTSRTKLDQLYRSRNEVFPEEDSLDRGIRSAMERVVQLSSLYRSEIVKPYQLYALLLALMHFEAPIVALTTDVPVLPHGAFDLDNTISRLAAMDEALIEDAATGPLANFVRASGSRTNVADQRLTRIRTFYTALCGAEANAI